jgi:phosphate transport system substrate-binding protein
MSQGNSKDTGALFLSLLITLGLIGGGLWYFGRQFIPGLGQSVGSQGSGGQSIPVNSETGTAQLKTTEANPQVLAIDGSVSLVALIKQFQVAFSQVNPAIPTTYGIPDGQPNGTNKGLENLLNGSVVMAASSRPLQGTEVQAGLQAVPIARDAIAVVVGVNNSFQGSLTLDQLKQIYQGKIINWSQVGGGDAPIKVINRAAASGTGSFFKDVVLLGENFAPDGRDFITLSRDETTPMLRLLGDNGIGYTTVTQAVDQKTIRVLAIDGIQPTDQAAVKDGKYPLSRVLYLVARQPTSPAVKQFIDLALSPQGQQTIQRVGFSPLK